MRISKVFRFILVLVVAAPRLVRAGRTAASAGSIRPGCDYAARARRDVHRRVAMPVRRRRRSTSRIRALPAPGSRSSTAACRAIAEGAHAAGNATTQMLRVLGDNPNVRLLFTLVDGNYRIVAKRSAGINRLADLKGKRIVVPRNTSANYFLVAMLRTAGLQESTSHW